MVKGLKQTSQTIAISFGVTESAANTFTQGVVDLNLDPLNNEVFVVTSMNLDPLPPDCIPGTSTRVNAAVTTTSKTGIAGLSDTNCLGAANLYIRQSGATIDGAAFQTMADSIPTQLEYMGIIATNDFFVAVEGNGNTGAKSVQGKLYGYRAKADAAVYAALVQSEVLSARR